MSRHSLYRPWEMQNFAGQAHRGQVVRYTWTLYGDNAAQVTDLSIHLFIFQWINITL